jgi:hypothetical protein
MAALGIQVLSLIDLLPGDIDVRRVSFLASTMEGRCLNSSASGYLLAQVSTGSE